MNLLRASATNSVPVMDRATKHPRSSPYDLVILGGGCAGLSLAMRLAELGPRCPRILIVEQRSYYANDRSWCFWDRDETSLRRMVKHRWPLMRVRDGNRLVTVNCGDTPYQMIAAETFYAEALAVIGRSTRIDLFMDTSVLAAPTKSSEYWHIETSEGLQTGMTVVDTRPRQEPRRGGAVLWQSFSGHEVKCEDPVFDPACLDLMDFSNTDPSGIRFDYVLPLSPHHALIEVTQFAPEPFHQQDLASGLTRATLRRVRGAPFKIVRSESSILPMGSAPVTASPVATRDPSYVYAGLANGGARPSTGYAFQRIQRWADSCARLIGSGEAPAGHPCDPLILCAMDHIFLSVLRTQPAAAPAVFLTLFERADAARVIRFLSDRGTLVDYLAIIAALPFGPFLKELPRGLMSMAGRAPA